MDSSNSQHSQPASSPDIGSASESDGSGSDSRTRSGSSGSTGEISPSASEIQEEGDDSSSSMQWKSSTGDQADDEEEDMDVSTTDSGKPTEPQPKSSAGKGKTVDTATSSSSGGREGKAEEIGLLTDLYSLHNKTGRYLLSGRNDQRDFYRFWIEQEGDYANKEELDKKINELHERFLKNMDKNVEGPVDPIDVEILRLSEWIWGGEIDSCEETDDDQEHDSSKDLTDHANAVDEDQQEHGSKDLSVNPNDPSRHEAAEARHGADHVDSKDLTKEIVPIDKDLSSKSGGNGSAAC